VELPAGVTPAPPRDYPELVARVTGVVSALVGPNESVLVVSRGDPDLLELGPARERTSRRARMAASPATTRATRESAVAQLHALREAGAQYLVFPATCTWWLDHYGALASYLLTSARAVHHDPDCLVFDLRPERNQPPS